MMPKMKAAQRTEMEMESLRADSELNPARKAVLLRLGLCAVTKRKASKSLRPSWAPKAVVQLQILIQGLALQAVR